ncbi:MAG: VCBS repeat-containing protein [Gemmataceae bacterium]|nr:VCBS repeat-containing protein [Gemmataceae bacterium]
MGLRRNLETLEDRSTPAVFNATVDPGPLGGNNTAAINEILGFFAQAVANGEADVINLLPGANYKFTTTNNVLDGNNALPVIGPDGTGKNGIVVNGQGATFTRFSSEDFRFFRVNGNNNNVFLEINDLTLSGGKSTDGGAIYVTGGANLRINNSTLSSNESTGNGGALATNGSTGGAVFNNVSFITNTAGGGGGAFSNSFDGFFQINDSRFIGNVSSGGTGGVQTFVGAFEFNDTLFSGNIGKFVGSAGAYSGSEAVFNRVTVINNTATNGGTGGITSGLANIRVEDSYIAGNKGLNTTGSGGGVQGAKVEVYNSTIHNNQSGGGGGIAGTNVIIRHSTITNNTSTFGIAAGGGIQASSIDMSGSIVAFNRNINGVDDIANIASTGMTNSTSKGFNFIEAIGPGAKFNGAGGDQFGGTASDKRIDPLLSNPAANGGPTFSRVPLSGSPVINAGSTVLGAFDTDQRGFARRVGGRIDIGAVEVQSGSSVGIVSGSNQVAQVNQAFANTLTVLVTDPNGAPLKNSLVSFQAPTTPSPTASANFFGIGPTTGVTTDAQGVATVTITANNVAGDYVVMAKTIDSPAPVFFNLRNTDFGIAIPTTGTIQIVSGNNQKASANSTFGSNLKAQVLDTKGVAIANVPITFMAPDVGASVTFSNGGTTFTTSTDAGGFVSIPVTANTLVGSYLVPATGPNVGTVSFSLTNIPAAASKVSVVSGTGQATLTNTAFNNPLTALVTDIFGNPVLSGVSVTFTGPAFGTGVDFAGKTSTVVLTNANGIASASPTANGVGGSYFVDASVAGGTAIGSFALSNIFVPPPPPPPPPPPNGIPVISDVANQTVTAGGSLTVPFSVFDAETLATNLTVMATSSNPAVTPMLTFGGSGNDRTITISTAGTTGTATITLTVTDELGAQDTDTFDITLVPPPPPPPPPPPNATPVITDIVNQTVQAGNSLSLPFVVVDAETAASALSITAKAANPGLIPTLTVSGAANNRTLNVVSATGVSGTTTVTVTVTDADGNATSDTFDVNVFTVPPPPPPPPPAVPLVGTQQFAVGTGSGGSQAVRFFNPDRTERFIAPAFPGLTGGVRTASGDFNGDGVADVVIGTGPGSITQVQVLDGNTGAELFRMQPFESAFTGGVYVATGDLTGDGTMDLVITPDEGGGPRARIFSGKGFTQIADFFVIDDPAFRGGARAAIGDVNGDGRADLVASAGFGGGPRIAGYDGKSVGVNPQRLFQDFFLFEDTLRNGAFIAVGDIDGDGFADIVGGGGPGGGPRVLGLSGKSLLTNAYITRANFFAGDLADRGGIRVAIKNLDGDNRADIIVGSGDGSGNRVTGFLGANILPDGTPLAAFNLDSFPGFAGGVFVG